MYFGSIFIIRYFCNNSNETKRLQTEIVQVQVCSQIMFFLMWLRKSLDFPPCLRVGKCLVYVITQNNTINKSCVKNHMILI